MDEHYIEFTVLIGPIGEPYKLHTFDADGTVNRTVHGDLAERLANAVWEVDHDASASTRITTETEMQAQADTVAERDRLRAVVEAAREVCRLREVSRAVDDPQDWADENEMQEFSRRLARATVATSYAIDLMGERLDQLDRSADMGGPEDHAEETCVDTTCPLHGSFPFRSWDAAAEEKP